MSQPRRVILWLPREDEHDLAASLGMCEPSRELLHEMVQQAQEQTARDLPGVPVVIKRWHVWRVVRTLAREGLTNTPEGRAAAYGLLAGKVEGS